LVMPIETFYYKLGLLGWRKKRRQAAAMPNAKNEIEIAYQIFRSSD